MIRPRQRAREGRTTRYGQEPYLNADMGYFGLKILAKALTTKEPVAAIKGGISIDGLNFTFDRRNVLTGLKHEICVVNRGEIKLLP